MFDSMAALEVQHEEVTTVVAARLPRYSNDAAKRRFTKPPCACAHGLLAHRLHSAAGEQVLCAEVVHDGLQLRLVVPVHDKLA